MLILMDRRTVLQMSARTAHKARGRSAWLQRSVGFTLVELTVVILIVAILSALAIPRLFDLSSNTRANLANATAGTLRSAADIAHYSWALHSSNMGGVTISLPDGSVAWMWRGYPDAGNCCAAGNGIEALIDVSGLYANQLNNAQTRLEVIGAPTQAHCSATYTEATNPGDTYSVLVDTSGC